MKTLFLTLVVLLAAFPAAGELRLDDGGTHVIDYELQDNVVLLAETTLQVIDGGWIEPPPPGTPFGNDGVFSWGSYLEVHNGTIVGGYGSTSGGNAVDIRNGIFDMTAGTLRGGAAGTGGGYGLRATEGATVRILGGSVHGGVGGTGGHPAMLIQDSPFVFVSGGTFRPTYSQCVRMSRIDTCLIVGGDFEAPTTLFAIVSNIEITGGRFWTTDLYGSGNVRFGNNSHMKLKGGLFNVSSRFHVGGGNTVLDVYGYGLTFDGYLLRGTLMDGNALDVRVTFGEGGVVNLIEPTSTEVRSWAATKALYRGTGD